MGIPYHSGNGLGLPISYPQDHYLGNQCSGMMYGSDSMVNQHFKHISDQQGAHEL
mgnify:CR=1 FL=1|tara:strand:+ start:1545 stop:1709 length:165 start_codon:yes stop_codon:yes gene_type:complete